MPARQPGGTRKLPDSAPGIAGCPAPPNERRPSVCPQDSPSLVRSNRKIVELRPRIGTRAPSCAERGLPQLARAASSDDGESVGDLRRGRGGILCPSSDAVLNAAGLALALLQDDQANARSPGSAAALMRRMGARQVAVE